MKTRSWSFHGLNLAVAAEEPILEALQGRLGRFPAPEPQTKTHLRFTFQRVPESRVDGLSRPSAPFRRVLELRGGAVLYLEAPQQLHIAVPGHASALCDLASGEVRVSYGSARAQDLGLLSHPFFTIALVELLKRHRLYMVHAAGLSLEGRGLLIAGASGCGKTTATIALLRTGFCFLSDDMAFLCRNFQQLRALAFPDELDVTPETAGFFPELQGLACQPPSHGRPKTPLDPAAVYGVRTCLECEPAVLLFSQVVPGETSALTALPKDAALIKLMCNVMRTDARSTPGASGRPGSVGEAVPVLHDPGRPGLRRPPRPVALGSP